MTRAKRTAKQVALHRQIARATHERKRREKRLLRRQPKAPGAARGPVKIKIPQQVWAEKALHDMGIA